MPTKHLDITGMNIMGKSMRKFKILCSQWGLNTVQQEQHNTELRRQSYWTKACLMSPDHHVHWMEQDTSSDCLTSMRWYNQVICNHVISMQCQSCNACIKSREPSSSILCFLTFFNIFFSFEEHHVSLLVDLGQYIWRPLPVFQFNCKLGGKNSLCEVLVLCHLFT